MEIEAPRSLLVLKPSSFGDIVHTLPAVARLKAAWPECRISWLANTEWMPLLSGNPDVAEVIGISQTEVPGMERSLEGGKVAANGDCRSKAGPRRGFSRIAAFGGGRTRQQGANAHRAG